MKKKMKVKFVGFWAHFDPRKFFLYQILTRYFDVQICDDPDYIIYSCHSLFDVSGEEHLQYNDCVKIFYTNENLAPDFNMCDYAIGFEYMDCGDRYYRYPLCYERSAKHPALYNREKRRLEEETRTGFCSFVYSNFGADPMRERLYQAINAYKPVAGGGKVHHTVDIPHEEGGSWEQERIEFEKNYKFSIACENSAHPGYSTEKILLAFTAGTIPIYWGDPLIKKIYNEKAFLCAYDYPDLDALVRRVQEIDNDPELYRRMAMEPVFAPDFDLAEIDRGMESFLVNIFQQPKEQAYRRNRVFWGETYARHYQEQRKLYDRMMELDHLYHSTLEYRIRHVLGETKKRLLHK